MLVLLHEGLLLPPGQFIVQPFPLPHLAQQRHAQVVGPPAEQSPSLIQIQHPDVPDLWSCSQTETQLLVYFTLLFLYDLD